MKVARISMLLSMLTIACGDEPMLSPDDDEPNDEVASTWAPLEASDGYAGKTLEEWGVEWGRWMFSPSTCETAFTDLDGSNCAVHQDPESPVFFMPHASSRAPRTECRVPYGKAIVAPIAITSVDNVGIEPPGSEEELRALASEIFESMRALKLRADGAEFGELQERSFGPTRYTYSIPPAPNFFSCEQIDDAEPMTVDPSFIAGYLAIFPPPELGRHELSYFGVMSVSHSVVEVGANMRFIVEEEDDDP